MTDEHNRSPDDRALLAQLAQLPPVEPPASLPDRFRQRSHRQAMPEVPRRWTLKRFAAIALAACLVLALGARWWGDRQRHEAEVARLRAQLAAALQDLSAARRMQGISTTEHAGVHDDRVADALIEALVHDPNTNVRVAAADAVVMLASPATLSRAATKAFATEESPFVQAELLEAIRRLPPDLRAEPLRMLLASPHLDRDLRAEAARSASL